MNQEGVRVPGAPLHPPSIQLPVPKCSQLNRSKGAAQVVTQTQKMRLRPIAHNQSRDKTEQFLIVNLKRYFFVSVLE